MRNTVERVAPAKNGSALELRTVSHTLETGVAERLQLFAFETRISESAVIEHALHIFLESASQDELASTLRAAGYGLRRKTG